MEFQYALAVWASTLSISFMWPQVFRVLRKRTVEGISVVGTIHGFAGSLLWSIYGIRAGEWFVAVPNAVTMFALGFVISAQVWYKVARFNFVLVSQLSVLTIGIATASISKSAIGLVAVTIGGTAIIPQTIRSARTSHQVGLSATTYALISIGSISWGVYGLLIEDPFVVTPNILIVPCALFISVRAIISHRRYSSVTEVVTVPAR